MSSKYNEAREQYAAFGIDADKALETLSKISLSLHCWQGDDVGGFETTDSKLDGGGIAVTGNFFGKARTINELRKDLELALSLIPGNHRLNLHAIYGDFEGESVGRDEISSKHFESWVDWAKTEGLGLDFNPTLFSHPKADSGFTLSHKDETIRSFWIEHVNRSREIAAYFGKELETAAVNNLWIPDGSKDLTVSRLKHRELLKDSLDKIYATDFDTNFLKDSVESKLFGIGSESFVVGSHDFYLGWALKNHKMICLDMGHFHPTESVADKISALVPFFDEMLFHVSRPVRWDSDHVVIFNDELQAFMQELVRADALSKANLALDFFDAELNRIGAWVIGCRAALKALLFALLEPVEKLRECEGNNDKFGRLALLEECKTLPLGAVWDHYCESNDVATGMKWIDYIHNYEEDVLSKRG